MGCEKLIYNASGSGVENFNPPRTTPKNNAVLPHAQARQPLEVALQSLDIASAIRQPKDGSLQSLAGHGSKCPRIVAHQIRDVDSSRQGRRQDGISIYLRAAA